MYKHAVMKIATLIVFVLLSIGCTSYPDRSTIDIPVKRGKIETADEARQIAMYISKELYLPELLFQQIYSDLIQIRRKLGRDDFGRVRFAPRWIPGTIVIGVNVYTDGKILHNNYSEWNELHNEIKPYNIEVAKRMSPLVITDDWRDPNDTRIGRKYIISFSEDINPIALAKRYLSFDGILEAKPRWLPVSDSNIYIRETPNGIEYLFVKSEKPGTPYSRHLYVYHSNGKLEMQRVYLSESDMEVWKKSKY